MLSNNTSDCSGDRNDKLMSHAKDEKPNSEEFELGAIDIFKILWSGKWTIIGITVVFAITSVIYSLTLPNVYKSTAILAPASQNSGAGGLAKLAGQFGGLASIAGINLGGSSGDDKVSIALELMKTWGFLESFINENEIQPEVYAVKGWDKLSGNLIYDDSIYNKKTNKWNLSSDEAKPEDGTPKSWKLYEALEERISISRDKNSGLIELSVEHYSPQVAEQWVSLLVVAINRHMKEIDRVEAKKSISYLEDKISETTVAEMRSVFYQLIEEQTKTLMLAEISDEYVLKTISAAKAPEEKFKPKRAVICVLGSIFGGILSVFWLLMRRIFI